MSTVLTRRQKQIYDLLRARAAAEGYPPTLDELCGELGLRSRGSMHKHVRALEQAGLIEPARGQHRGIRLRATGIPLLGRIAAGQPIEAIAVAHEVEVPDWLRGSRECYALEVRGDSMVEEGILDGDWVVVEHRAHADNGDIVVALIDDAQATLKRIEHRGNRIVLHPANSTMMPLEYPPHRVRIQGILVAQMRSYRSRRAIPPRRGHL